MSVSIRPADRSDAATILQFVRDLAAYEKAADAVEATVDTIAQSLFGPDSISKAVLCERDGAAIGFAVWFLSYSTWQARNGLYLEDLYVTPEARGTGAGRALLRHLARLAVETGCGRFEWSVLNWNETAIRTYRAIGAEPLQEWTRYRLSGQALRDFAAS
jgi:GNAT superfamily N-acetyltransferase